MKSIKKWKKKNLLLWIVVLGLFVWSQPVTAQVDGKPSLDFPMEEELIQKAKETVKAYEMGNWDALREHSDADAMFYNLGSYDSLSLKETINYWSKGREIATPVLAEDGVWLGVTVPEGPREGNWVLHWGYNTLSYPNGETISFPYHVALKFKDDKVSRAHFYYDNNRIIRGLGYEIRPPFDEELNDSLSQGDKSGNH
ncbi:nuclear transport factor 2 family protein [Salinimicrobium sp. TH3]|uniref:nuclear transport factor 2 family protein n=1 Tax=Salinimicrobium sp. TH3 TaxID=2997342 RepID=UPI002274922A|nr:hypothetical protein [Salinimicrobium sp. TH3]MCY2687510.1 hypothetical protein [Salinimicrobium sp. TH3]